MPIREKRTERIAGLFVIVGLLMLGGLVFQFGSIKDRMKNCYELLVEFPNAAGIIADSEVRLRGTKVGKVSSSPKLIMKGNDSSVLMQMSIREDVKIPNGSSFRISSSGFIGDKFIEITPSNTPNGEYHSPGQTLIGDSSGSFDAIKGDAERIAKETLVLLKDVQVTVEKLNTGLESIEKVSNKIDLTITSINQDFLTKKNAENLSLIMDNVQVSSNNIKAASAELQPALAEARVALSSIQKSTELALQDLPSAVKSIDTAAQKASKTMDSLQNKNGLIGALTQDPEVSSDAKEFLKNIKRYGILRYRDDDAPEDYDPRNKFRGDRR